MEVHIFQDYRFVSPHHSHDQKPLFRGSDHPSYSLPPSEKFSSSQSRDCLSLVFIYFLALFLYSQLYPTLECIVQYLSFCFRLISLIITSYSSIQKAEFHLYLELINIPWCIWSTASFYEAVIDHMPCFFIFMIWNRLIVNRIVIWNRLIVNKIVNWKLTIDILLI